MEHRTVTEFAANGLTYQSRETTTGKPKFGGFTGVVVSITAGRVYVTEKSSRLEPGTRYDLGPAVEVTITAQRLMLMLLVTLVGNGNTCPVKMNPESADALRAALEARRTEARTTQDAASVAQAIERFAQMLSRGTVTDQIPTTEKTKFLGAA